MNSIQRYNMEFPIVIPRKSDISKEQNIEYILNIYRDFLKKEFPNHTFELTDFHEEGIHRAFNIKIDDDIIIRGPVHCYCNWLYTYEDIERIVKAGWVKTLKNVLLIHYPDLVK